MLPPALCCVATDRRCVKAELPASRRPSRRLSHCAIAPAQERRFETQLAASYCTLMQCPARPAICIAMEHDIPHCPPSRCQSCICSAKSAAALPEPASGLTRTNWQPWSNCSASCLRVEARPPAHQKRVCIVYVAGGSVSQRAQINSCLWHADAAGARVAPKSRSPVPAGLSRMPGRKVDMARDTQRPHPGRCGPCRRRWPAHEAAAAAAGLRS